MSTIGVDEVAPEHVAGRSQLAMRSAEEKVRGQGFGAMQAKAFVEAYIPVLKLDTVAGRILEKPEC